MDFEFLMMIELTAGPHLGQVPVSVRKVPLALAVTGVVARHGCRDGAELRQDAALHVTGVKVSTDVQSLDHKFAGSLAFGGFIQSVIYRVLIVLDVIGVHSEFTRKILPIQDLVVVA
jgi:hypothetical protein